MIRLRRPTPPAPPAATRQFGYLDAFAVGGTPYGVAVAPDGSAVYVTDTKNGTVTVHGPDGAARSALGQFDEGRTGRPGRLDYPTGVAVAADGAVSVVDPSYSKIQAFDAADPHPVRRTTDLIALAQPQGIGVAADGTAYVADPGTDLVMVFDPAGACVGYFGGPGAAAGQFRTPAGVAVGPDGTVFVADTGNNRVQAFTPGGEFVRQFGTAGAGPGEFRTPAGVAVSAAGTVFVADYGNHRVQAFTPAGAYLGGFGGRGIAAAHFNGPTGVAVAGTGVVYVADQGNGRVQRWFAPADWVGGPARFATPVTLAPACTPSTLGPAFAVRAGAGLSAPRVELAGVPGSRVVLAVEAGATLSADGGVAVGPAAVLSADGTVAGDVTCRGTVTGRGAITGRLTVADGGVVVPGAGGPGTLAAGAVTLGTRAGFDWRLADAGGEPGVGFSVLRVGGTLEVTATAARPVEVTVVLAPGAAFDAGRSHEWPLATAGGGVSGLAPDKFRVAVRPADGANPPAGAFAVGATGDGLVLLFRPAAGVPTVHPPAATHAGPARAPAERPADPEPTPVSPWAKGPPPLKRERWTGWQAVPPSAAAGPRRSVARV
jgi:sugar lactone lactonase YvrE